jgi:hypothetical protein
MDLLCKCEEFRPIYRPCKHIKRLLKPKLLEKLLEISLHIRMKGA